MKYSIGLDIGTNSVGWAVVDENNQLVKKNGFTLWGVRMFDEAIDASETRNHRSERRRIARRKYRLDLLKSIFEDEIKKTDSTFFQRLEDSFYKIEDKKYNNYHNLFNDTYTDKEFFDLYPTPYHLRKYLMETKEKVDIRFLYLAMHNMIKYRGNFLRQGDVFNLNDISRIKDIFDELNNLIVELSYTMEDYDEYFALMDINENTIKSFGEILSSNLKISEKKLKLKQLFDVENRTFINEFLIPLFSGTKCSMNTLYPIKSQKYEKVEININVEDLETEIEEYKKKIPEFSLAMDYIVSIKEIVDYYFLIKLLQNSSTLSEAMVKQYNDHQNDLKLLKKTIKSYLPEKYNECFRINREGLNNYPKYIGMNFVSSKKPERFKHCTREQFYQYINSLFKKIDSEECNNDINYILNKIDNNDFLLRQNSDKNGSIPMQLNLNEMIVILNNQEEHYSFLKKITSDGITNKEKIISIFKYVIPYYIGPLNSKSDRSWIVRNEEKIYPWNLEKVVDVESTAVKFIENMQRKCTYLKGENDYCLPKNSIIFSKYNCLSYLNKIRINGLLINSNLKKEIFNNVFLKKKKPTEKDIYNYLVSNFGELDIKSSNMKELPKLNCNMASYIKFSEIFEKNIIDELDLVEQIIKDIVIFSDKKILENRLLKAYNLDINIVKKIKDLNYKGYSNLSKKLLYDLKIINPETGEYYGNVIDIMENTNNSLQEILYNPEFRLIDLVDKYNKEILNNVHSISLEDFMRDNINVSPIMRRPLIQAHTIIKEVEKILNARIDKYYIECTRTNKAEKKETISRYSKLKDLYKNCKEMASILKIDLNKLKEKLDANQNNLKSDILYLYFTQLGKCMYTMKDIDFDTLVSNNNMYDIDHIYPQALIKDDSLNNRVLVEKTKNNEKKDNMLFEMPEFLHKDAYAFYDKLRSLNLISKEKYNRLTKKELTQGELDTFVNRQIVATNQAVKGLIEVLKLYDRVDASNIIYSKAENISLARQMFDLPKSRTANNYHHAHDAYLNVVIGRAVHKYFISNHFNSSGDYYRLKAEGRTTNVEKLLSKNVYCNGKLIWDKNNIIKLLNKNLYERFDVSETTRTFNSNQLFKKVTIKKAGDGNPVPMKETGPRSIVEKYGGITSYSYSRYIILEIINKKGEKEYILESIPKVYEKKIKQYLTQKGYSNYIIINENIKSNAVIINEALKFSIASKTNESYNLKNLHDRYFNKYYTNIIKKIDKYNNNLILNIPMVVDKDELIISPARNSDCKPILLTKKEIEDLYNEIVCKYQKSIYNYSIINSICTKAKSVDINLYTFENALYIITELLKILQTNSRKTADLRLIGLSKTSGTITMTKKLKVGMKFIAESVTGYYTKTLFEV